MSLAKYFSGPPRWTGPSAGDRSTESQQGQSVRPCGWQSPGHRDRGGLPGCATADLQSPPFPAGTVRGARFTIGTRHDHLIGVHRNWLAKIVGLHPYRKNSFRLLQRLSESW